ncbi:MAG: amidohydrolase family protein [Spirochaetaceae bacterium]|jgi:N-acyl-D-amino-acid deacylase|nr:amidohydrolase family protein [Spirochaetaceae bacterium]
MTKIINAFIVDGTGKPGYPGDVLIDGGVIAAVGTVNAGADETIDAGGKTLCPGFIDIHRHCDAALFSGGAEKAGAIELLQGITTCFAGNCGMAPVPNRPETRAQLQNYVAPCLGSFENETFSSHQEYAGRLKSVPLPFNMGFFAGMGAIRIAAKGFEGTPYTQAEMEKAQALFREALDAGARGLSIGLMYVPEAYCTPDEIAALARVMKGRGILCTHMRWETERLPDAVSEVIAVAKQAEVPLEISHFKAAGVRAWGGALARAIDIIEKERSGGMDITCDFYPYDCGSSTMMQMLPPGFLAAGIDQALAGLNKPQNIERLRSLLESGEPGWDNLSKTIGWDRTIISSVTLTENRVFLGKTVSEAAREARAADEAEFVARLMYAERGKVGIINRSMTQTDIDAIARLPYSILISDALYGDMRGPHPRLTGAFPHFLRDFVFDRPVLPLETAVRKMSAAPAARLGLFRRGVIAPGMRADLLVFDNNAFRDEATYLEPMKMAAGLSLAFVNGVTAVENAALTGASAGRVV